MEATIMTATSNDDNQLDLVSFFHNQTQTPIRTMMQEGQPWFVAKDVAKALGYSESSLETIGKVIGNVPSEWVVLKPFPVERGTSPQPREIHMLSEQGLYFFLGRSDKPAALPFQKWIAGEVLPALRKYGGYLTPDTLEAALTDPDTIIRLAQNLKREREQRKQAEAALAEAEPKALTYDAVVAPRKLSILVFCRRFKGVNLNLVRAAMADAGILYRRGGSYRVYAAYRDSHFSERTDPKTGRMMIIAEPQGQQLLAKLWRERKLPRKKA